ncbi:Membrane-associated guanylate kinase, WW and PDZ domain-containing protein 3 [Larimichthys crocea]|uniref:Membrane-associated guanylate kinase, WW and PDZ domain-containing protein 3 n=1 Tax=Larimichthys crocea TaxID=215358 RepID=A0A6G0HF12_LARCR|nr:Membrane-associated guanylate kinase, WW and PDZ domain-containing protein 3 [Larimichthys crocea]
MGLYVLGLMEGGPAQRSTKIQVSDQLVEINGDSTSGMTHSQAVEQIRRGGHRIHLVLKKGNGYVPDYGPEEGALSPSSQQWGGGSGTGGGERRKRRTRREGETIRRTGGGRGGEGLGPPDLDLDIVEEDAREEERRREEEEGGGGGRRREAKKSDCQTEGETGCPDGQGRSSRSGASSWDTFVPKERVEVDEPGGGVRERRRRSETKSRRRATEEVDERRKERHSTARLPKHSGSSAPAQRRTFSFLRPDDDDERRHSSDCESAASFSEVSQSAASIAATEWREDSDWRRAKSPWEQGNSPGRWLKPTTQDCPRF